MPKTPAEAPPASPVSMEQRNVFRSAVDLIVGVVIRGQRNSITGLASQFAYNAFIATVPLLLLVIAAVSLVGGKDAPAGCRIARGFTPRSWGSSSRPSGPCS